MVTGNEKSLGKTVTYILTKRTLLKNQNKELVAFRFRVRWELTQINMERVSYVIEDYT